MPNIENTELSYVYDMKGSSINRAVFKDIPNDQLKKKCPTGGWVLKDLDYIRMKEMFKFLKLSQSDAARIMKQLTIDVNFLVEQRFMDYSLLMAIKKINREDKIADFTAEEINEEVQEESNEIDQFEAMRNFHANDSIVKEVDKMKEVDCYYSTDGKWCYQLGLIDYL